MLPGNLPFLIGWPSLAAMRENLNCEYINLSVKVEGEHHRIQVTSCGHHGFLLFRSGNRSNYNPTSYYLPGVSRYTPFPRTAMLDKVMCRANYTKMR